jgi:hypothetical protein
MLGSIEIGVVLFCVVMTAVVVKSLRDLMLNPPIFSEASTMESFKALTGSDARVKIDFLQTNCKLNHMLFPWHDRCRGGLFQLSLMRSKPMVICSDFRLVKQFFRDGKIPGGILGSNRRLNFDFPNTRYCDNRLICSVV